jgi:hypothetical protein
LDPSAPRELVLESKTSSVAAGKSDVLPIFQCVNGQFHAMRSLGIISPNDSSC